MKKTLTKEHIKHLERGDRAEIARKHRIDRSLVTHVINGTRYNSDIYHAILEKVVFRMLQKEKEEAIFSQLIT